jgi:hypothetical protein
VNCTTPPDRIAAIIAGQASEKSNQVSDCLISIGIEFAGNFSSRARSALADGRKADVGRAQVDYSIFDSTLYKKPCR